MSAILKALIFDVDGTLAETEELHRRAFNLTFEHYGLDWHWDRKLYAQLLKVAGGRRRIQHFIEEYQPSCAGDFIDETAKMHQIKTTCYGKLVSGGRLELRPGIAALFEQALARGLKLAIVTTTSRVNVDTLFAATIGTKMLANFNAVCCGDEVTNVKPDPELYNLALEKLKLPAENCLAFEDAHIGLAAASAAGIDTIITFSTYTRDEDFTGAQAVMQDLEQGGFELATYL